MQLIEHKTTQQTCSTLLAVYIQPPMERFNSMLHNAFHHLAVVHNMSAEPVKKIYKHILSVYCLYVSIIEVQLHPHQLLAKNNTA
jgi:hypothetical protein